MEINVKSLITVRTPFLNDGIYFFFDAHNRHFKFTIFEKRINLMLCRYHDGKKWRFCGTNRNYQNTFTEAQSEMFFSALETKNNIPAKGDAANLFYDLYIHDALYFNTWRKSSVEGTEAVKNNFFILLR